MVNIVNDQKVFNYSKSKMLYKIYKILFFKIASLKRINKFFVNKKIIPT